MTDRSEIRQYLLQPYSRILVPSPSGGYFAEVLELTGCFSHGKSVEEAMRNLEEAMEGWIEAALEMGQSIPLPLATAGYSGRVLLRLPKSLHKAAARRAEIEGVSLNQYLVTAVAAHLEGDNRVDKIVGQLSQELSQGKWRPL